MTLQQQVHLMMVGMVVMLIATFYIAYLTNIKGKGESILSEMNLDEKTTN